MKLIENMTISELQLKANSAQTKINRIESQIEKIHGKKNYQDEVAKYFAGGMVGFRKDRKKVNQSINQYTDNAVKACALYEEKDCLQSELKQCEEAIAFIEKAKGNENDTVFSIKEAKKAQIIESKGELVWEKVKGHYGTAYRHEIIEIEKCDVGFVAIRDTRNGNLISHCKTIKEAKAFAALIVSKKRAAQ